MRASEALQSSGAAFGTSGLRGLVEDLDPPTCFAATLAFLQRVDAAPGPVLLAHDLRPSSPKIATFVAGAIRAAGHEPVFCGTIPTPALVLAGIGRARPSIMVTGSHIPFDRNGIKFHRADGEIDKGDEAAILASDAALPNDLHAVALPEPDGEAETDYAIRYLQAFPEVFKDMRVGLWQHSAVGRDFNEALFGDLGGRVVPLGRSDTFVPIDTEAVADADRAQAKAWVEEHDLDLLISTDGDGDRPLLADGNGDFFRGDALGVLAARCLHADHVVTTVSATTALERSGWFDHVTRTPIGSPHVIAGMDAAHGDTIVGFEPNGGFLTRTPARVRMHDLPALPTRDAILPAVAAVALARREGMQLADLHAMLPARATVSDRLENRPTAASKDYLAKLSLDPEARAELLQGIGKEASVDETDGLRITTATEEIVHLRPSGNAPEFRIYAEAVTPERAAEIMASVRGRLSAALPQA